MIQLIPEWIRWCLSVPLVLLGGMITYWHWEILIRRKSASMVPLLGGLFLMSGLWIIPLEAINPYAWLALVIDLGALPLIACTIADWGWRALRAKRVSLRRARRRRLMHHRRDERR